MPLLENMYDRRGRPICRICARAITRDDNVALGDTMIHGRCAAQPGMRKPAALGSTDEMARNATLQRRPWATAAAMPALVRQAAEPDGAGRGFWSRMPYGRKSAVRRTTFTPSDPDAFHRRFERIRERADRETAKAGQPAPAGRGNDARSAATYAGWHSPTGRTRRRVSPLPPRPARRRLTS